MAFGFKSAKKAISESIAEGDRTFWGMQDFDFAQI